MKRFSIFVASMALLGAMLVATACKKECPKNVRCRLEDKNLGSASDPYSGYYYDRSSKECVAGNWADSTDVPFGTLEKCQICECKY